MVEREVDSERATHRAADQVRRLQRQLLQQGEKVGDRRPGLRRKLRFAKPALVRPDDVEVSGKRRYLPVPHTRIRDAGMQEDHGRTIPFALVMDPRSIDPH